jgi:myo-inositol-1(or 4)-monophosphatase
MTPALSAHETGKRLEAAERIARVAGERALGYFGARADLEIRHKAAQDRVSEADRAVETLIRDAVAAEFPDDAFLGEEHGEVGGASPFLWVVDPIDGTTPFLSGLPDWCVSIAVAVEGAPVIGAIHAPAHRETYAGASGLGAKRDGETLRIAADARLGDGMFAVGGSLRCDAEATGAFITRLMQAGGMAFHNGSGALMLAYVAAGRLVGYYDEIIMPWDCFAGLVLVEEAGGRTRYGRLDATRAGASMLAGAPAVFARAVELVPATGIAGP